jgi:hypothetical protein
MHRAYKHLTDRLRIAELTIPQLAGVFTGLLCGLLFALYVSPFSPYLTLVLSIYIAGVPAGTVVLATSTEFDLWLYVKACVGGLASDGRFTPGPGQETPGYSITANAGGGAARALSEPLNLGELWGL